MHCIFRGHITTACNQKKRKLTWFCCSQFRENINWKNYLWQIYIYIYENNNECRMEHQGNYSLSTRNSKCIHMGVIPRKEPCQAKIWYLWIQIFVQQNITGFDVSVNDPFRGFFVQVEETSCHTCNYLEPRCPIQACRFHFVWKSYHLNY